MTDTKINDTTSYPNTTPAPGDHVIGTDVSNTSNSADGETVTFLMSAIGALMQSTYTGWRYVETVWDYSVDGVGDSHTTSAFEDGYEYMVTAENMSHQNGTGRSFVFQIQKESDDSWVPSTTSGTVCEILSGLVLGDYFSAIIRCINPRLSADVHLFEIGANEYGSTTAGTDTAPTSTGSVSYPANIGFATATKVKAIRLVMSGVPQFDSGIVKVYRRAISNA